MIPPDSDMNSGGIILFYFDNHDRDKADKHDCRTVRIVQTWQGQ